MAMKFSASLENADFVYEDPDKRYYIAKYVLSDGNSKFFVVDGKPFLDNTDNLEDAIEIINRKRLINSL